VDKLTEVSVLDHYSYELIDRMPVGTPQSIYATARANSH